MDAQTLNRKSVILEHALAASAGVYYNINLTQDRIPGAIEQCKSVKHMLHFSEVACSHGKGGDLRSKYDPTLTAKIP